MFLLCLMMFLSIEIGAASNERLAGTRWPYRHELERALRSFAGGTRTYLVVTPSSGSSWVSSTPGR